MIDLDEELARVRKEWYAANVVAADARDQADAKMTALRREMDAKIEAEFGERLRSASSRCNQLRSEVDALKDQIRTRDVELPYPVGTALQHYQTERYSRDLKATGKIGQIEIITEASAHPENLGPWSRAKVGEVVVRFLKKDGSPSAKYERWQNSWSPNVWRVK